MEEHYPGVLAEVAIPYENEDESTYYDVLLEDGGTLCDVLRVQVEKALLGPASAKDGVKLHI